MKSNASEYFFLRINTQYFNFNFIQQEIKNSKIMQVHTERESERESRGISLFHIY